MNGSAPNFSLTGFHSLVHRKAKPNLWRERAELLQSWNTSKTVTSSILAAKAIVSQRAIVSPVGPEVFAGNASTANGAAMLLSVARYELLLARVDLCRSEERRVGKEIRNFC